MKKWFLLAISILVGMQYSAAQLSEYAKKEYIVAGDTLRYRELSPKNVKEGVKYPLVVFLHGSGERGCDNEAQLTWGGQMFLNPEYRAKYPAYVLFPQCPKDEFWGYAPQMDTASAMPDSMPVLEKPVTNIRMIRALIKDYIAHGKADADRVYIVGLSMGGMGVYDLACRYPETVTAAVVICGAVNPVRLKEAKGIKWSIYHGDNDPEVPIEAARAAYTEMKRLKYDVRYHEFVGCTHNSWNPAFNMPDFMKWLFSQSKLR